MNQLSQEKTIDEENQQLRQKIARLKHEKHDLEIALLTVVEHGDIIEAQLAEANQQLKAEITERILAEARLKAILAIISQKNQDLEIIVDTLAEHGDLVEAEWLEKAVTAKELATIDSLTQIANRRKLDEYLEQEFARCSRIQQPLSFIICDVDCFKLYNDHYGHQAGDTCLVRVAAAITRSVKRPGDLVARYGGEEFCLILPNTDAEGALYIAETIQQELRNLKIRHSQSQISPYVTLSMGVVSIIPNEYVSPLSLIAEADRLLYIAKQKGRNKIAY